MACCKTFLSVKPFHKLLVQLNRLSWCKTSLFGINGLAMFTQMVSKSMIRRSMDGVNTDVLEDFGICPWFIHGENTPISILEQEVTAKSTIPVFFHPDVRGKFLVSSIGQSVCFVVFNDRHSSYLSMNISRNWAEVYPAFLEWLQMAQKQTDRRLKVLHLNNRKIIFLFWNLKVYRRSFNGTAS